MRSKIACSFLCTLASCSPPEHHADRCSQEYADCLNATLDADVCGAILETCGLAPPPRDALSDPGAPFFDASCAAPRYVAGANSDTPLLIVRGDAPGKTDSYGSELSETITVDVQRTTPFSLVLSAGSPTEWIIDALPGTQLTRVIVHRGTGGDHTVSVPIGTVVQFVDDWPALDPSPANFIARAEAETGATLEAYLGCRTLDTITIE